MLQCTCNTLLPVAWLLHWYNKHMHKPLRGVNLGGWLVLERWMTPSVFAGTDASNEHQLMMQPDGPERIAKHRQEFMTEADFAWLHAHGIEALRVPVGYWVLESQDGYLEATKQLDWCFAMAQNTICVSCLIYTQRLAHRTWATTVGVATACHKRGGTRPKTAAQPAVFSGSLPSAIVQARSSGGLSS